MKSFLIAVILLIPSFAFAASPVAGTNDYLRSLGYTDAQLTERVATEDRELFDTAEGTGANSDPIGDVVSRSGETSGIHNAWGDISDATLSKNDEAQTWDLRVTVSDDVPQYLASGQKAQWYVYVDRDGDMDNNATAGIRGGSDAEISVQYNAENGWYTDYRWYNKEADFWATNKETTTTFDISGNTMTFHIPFAELSSALNPHWRTAVGIADGKNMQIDVIPGTGFPPPKGQAYPTEDTKASDRWVAAVAATVLVGYATFQWVAKKRQA